MEKYTEDELADLTPEERAALQEDPGDDENLEDGNEADKGGDKSGLEAGGDGSDNSDKNDNEKQHDAADHQDDEKSDDKSDENGKQSSRDDGEESGQDVDTQTAPTKVREPAPVFVVEAPKDSDKQLTEIKQQKIALADQFDEGDITNREYQQKLDELNQQERKIEREIDRARLAEDMEAQRKNNAWNDAQADFMADHPEYEDDTRREMFNAVFRNVAKRDEFSALPVTRANSLKLLRAAHEAFIKVAGKSAGPGDENENGKETAKQQKKKELPPTLAGIPASDVTDTNAGRWASLDRLRDKDYQAYEDKLFSMSDADRDAYLADR
ncbi:hypothetical protein BKM35_22115 [Salmonella enterica]|nr:hypothetical protein [Salmonella enterica]